MSAWIPKPAPVDRPVHALLAERWSPRAFDPRAVPMGELESLFEAARWAPSSYNDQPWSFLFAAREDGEAFERFASLLAEGNAWARRAPVLALSVARLDSPRDGSPNRYAWHDTGAATFALFAEATARGLVCHPMGGFHREAAADALALPAGHEPVAMIAIGYPGPADSLPPALAERERAPRVRRALAEQVFRGRWGTPMV